MTHAHDGKADAVNLVDVFSNRYTLAGATAVFGFAAAALLERVKARSVPRKALSWDVSVEAGPAQQKREGGAKMGITYDNSPVSNLFQIFIKIENTGNLVVKDQYLRFKFPDKARILECVPSPTPERELAVSEVNDSELSSSERRYRIGHLEVGQSVSFLVAADGGAWVGWDQIYPYNDEGNVRFQRRDIARQRADEQEIVPFVRNLVALILILLLSMAVNGSSLGLGGALLFIAIPPAYSIISKAPSVVRALRLLAAARDEWWLHGQGIQAGEHNIQNNYYTAENAPQNPS